ncbi:hypothetical protein DPSP01_009914 [Paraphaeosphaeria sporulosa]
MAPTQSDILVRPRSFRRYTSTIHSYGRSRNMRASSASLPTTKLLRHNPMTNNNLDQTAQSANQANAEALVHDPTRPTIDLLATFATGAFLRADADPQPSVRDVSQPHHSLRGCRCASPNWTSTLRCSKGCGNNRPPVKMYLCAGDEYLGYKVRCFSMEWPSTRTTNTIPFTLLRTPIIESAYEA